jgi:hypothetical protein
MAEREGFEPSRGLAPPYRFSKPTPSATWVPLHGLANWGILTHPHLRGYCLIRAAVASPGYSTQCHQDIADHHHPNNNLLFFGI